MSPSPQNRGGGRDGQYLAISSQGNAATQANTGRVDLRARSVFCRNPCLPDLNLRQGRADSKHLSFGLQLCRSGTWDSGAEHQADRILNQAGVRAVWFDCSVKAGKLDKKSICRNGLANQNIVLRLLSRYISTRVPDFAFGFAVYPGLASVYYKDAALMAERQQLGSDFPPLLGCLIAHEIGHLLLNSYGHSPTGVMQAEWGAMQLRQSFTGLMTFTPEQSRRIRAQVQTRMSLPLDGRTPETSSR
jgi:hypothetical protein